MTYEEEITEKSTIECANDVRDFGNFGLINHWEICDCGVIGQTPL